MDWNEGFLVSVLTLIQRVETVRDKNLPVEVSHHRGEAIFRRNTILGDFVQLALDVLDDERLDTRCAEIPEPQLLADLGGNH